MKHIYITFFASFICVFSSAQCLLNVNDTLSCHPGSPIQISADINGYCKTLNYEINSIPFQEYTLSQPFSVFMIDDDITGPFPIGFDFNFFGNTYSQFYIGSNGWISFSPGQSVSYSPKPLPSNDNIPTNVIMGPWEDWDPSQSGFISFETIGISPYRKLVVDFDFLGHYDCGVNPSVLGDFQIVLNEQNFVIESHLKNKSSCDTIKAVQGIQNINGTKAFVVDGRNATNWSAYYESIQYIPNNESYFSWILGSDVVSTNDSPIFTPQESTLYTLNYSDDAGCIATEQFEIYIPTPLDPIIQRIGNQLHVNPNGYFLQWYLNGHPLPGETLQTTSLDSYGLYTVEVTDPTNGCSYMSRVHLYASSSNLNNMMIDEIFIYPNPTLGKLVFDFGSIQQELKISIFDIHGSLLLTYKSDQSHQKNLNLSKGLYLVELANPLGQSITKKITIN